MSQGSARGLELLFPADGYRLGEVLYFTADDTFEKADYPGMKAIRVRVQAGGGGGGDTDTGVATGASGGGGGGGYAESILLANTLLASETVTVGAGGSGGNNSNGSKGDDSSFGSHVVAEGGNGGESKSSGDGQGGVGGEGSVGDLLLGGSAGVSADFSDSNAGGGAGGSSYLGGGGHGGDYGGSGREGGSGKNYGGGGGGSSNVSAGQPTGGDGAPGIVIVEILYDQKLGLSGQGYQLGETIEGSTFEKADYPGIRAIRVNDEILAVNELPSSYDVPSPLFSMADQGLSNATSPNSSGSVQWGSEELVIPDPGRAVQVMITVSGRILCNAGRTFANTNLQVSSDGGSNFSTIQGVSVDISSEDGESRLPISLTGLYSGTPTGDIQFRCMLNHGSSSSDNNLHWHDGLLVAVMMPLIVPQVELLY